MNDTTFQGNGKIAYVPVVVNTKPTKLSNADRIRSLTDEELAELIGDNIDCLICKKSVFPADECPRITGSPCYELWAKWLKQEASNE